MDLDSRKMQHAFFVKRIFHNHFERRRLSAAIRESNRSAIRSGSALLVETTITRNDMYWIYSALRDKVEFELST